MSGGDGGADFVVALFSVGGLRLGVDASTLVGLAAEGEAEGAVDPASLFGLQRSPGSDARCGRFRFSDLGDAELVLLLGERVDIVPIERAAIFALPFLLEELEQHALLGLLKHEQHLWTLLDVRQLCERHAKVQTP